MHGISTRSVDELVKALGMTGVSKGQVSRLCEELDERVGAFLNRLIEEDWPYLWIDATYVKTGAFAALLPGARVPQTQRQRQEHRGSRISSVLANRTR